MFIFGKKGAKRKETNSGCVACKKRLCPATCHMPYHQNLFFAKCFNPLVYLPFSYEPVHSLLLSCMRHLGTKAVWLARGDMDTKQAWSRSLRYLPTFNQSDVDQWANNEAHIPRAKQTKGHSNFVEGYIHEIECKYEFLRFSPILVSYAVV